MRPGLRRWLFLPPLAVGVAVLAILVANRAEPERAPLVERARPVRVIEVPRVTVVPRALGYGNVEPGRRWEAVAEVSGKVLERHPGLKRGAFLKAGEVLLRIDPTDFQLAVAEFETKVRGTQAQLAELSVREANTRASLAIEEEALTLNRKEVERKRKLSDRGTVARSELEREQRSVLAQRQSVQNLKNTLSLVPAERRLLDAQLARDEAQLESVRRDLERTIVVSPLAGRVATVDAESGEYVRQGDVLAVLDSIDTAEVPAQVPMNRMGALIRSEETISMLPADMEVLRKALGLSARVHLRGEGLDVTWEGRVARMSDTVDPQTRTIGVIVEVQDPYKDVQPGVRPPLLKGLFVEVELRGRPRPDRIVVPRSALHAGQVFVVDAEDRLRKRHVGVLLEQPEFVVIGEGVRAGERIVVSDLVPAIEGMLLEPVVDPDLLQRLVREARGEG